MATVNTIKTRILNKYDILANYANFTPLKGEICVCQIGEQVTTNKGLNGDTTKTPIVGIKVGDGTTTFNNLPWIQAVAGDVSTFVKGIVNEAKFNELVNALIANAKLATAEQLSALDTRLQQAETDIDNLEDIVVTGDDSNANLRIAINNVLGASTDTAEANTVFGAKKYAEAQASAAQTAAQNYADGKFEEKGVAAGLVTALENGKVKTNTEAITGINEKIGEVAYSGDSMTAAIAALQSAVGDGAEGLGTKVAALEEIVGDSQAGLVKDVADLKQADIDMGNRVDGLEGRIEANEGKLAGIEGTVADAIGAVDAKAEQNKTDIATVSGKVATLVGEDTSKSVRAIAAEETAKIVAGADANYDTLKEIADWIMSDTTGAAEMANDIAEMQGLLGVTEGAALPKTVDERIADAIAAENLDQYATDSEMGAAVERIAALEAANGANGAVTQAIATAKQEAIDTVVGTSADAKTASTVYGAKAFATDAAATAKSEAIADAATKYELIGVAETKVNALANGAVKTNTSAIETINTEIDAMDATYADTNAGVMTAITQEDGKITSVTQRKIKAADMDENDVFVFYCGEATGYTLTSVEI